MLAAVSQDGASALLVASSSGHLSVVFWLVEKAGCVAKAEKGKVALGFN